MSYKQLWTTKARGMPRRSFLCGGAVVGFTDTTAFSIDAATGKDLGKIKWDRCGEPWVDADGGGIWIPTVKGFLVVGPTLKEVRAIDVPKPNVKGETPAFYGTADGRNGDVSIRVARTKTPMRKYYLTTVRDKSKTADLTLLVLESETAVHGVYAGGVVVCTVAAAACGEGAETDLVAFAADDGHAIVRAKSTNVGRAQAIGPHAVIQRDGRPALVFHNKEFVELPAVGRVEMHGKHVYVVGHRSIVRCASDWSAAATFAVRTPPSEVDPNRVAPASVCMDGKLLRVVERVPPLPTTFSSADKPAPLEYVTRNLDPVTLKALGDETAFKEMPFFHVLGKAEKGFVGTSMGVFSGCTF